MKNNSIRLIILFSLLCLCFSCHKQENHQCIGCYGTPATDLPPIPYNTSNLSGTFICQNAIYNPNEFNYVFAKFYNVMGSQKNGIPSIFVTSDSLIFFDNMAFSISYLFFDDSRILQDSIVTWRISDTSTFSFSFTDTSYPPFINIVSDTITNNSGVATLIDSFVNTDSIGVAINDSVHYYNTASDTINLNLASYGITADTSVGILISLTAYKHQYHEVNGFNYLFIKEYEQAQKSVWVK